MFNIRIKKIKALLLLISLCGIMQACNQGPDYKAVRQQVINQHDKLMGDDEKGMAYKMKLDTLVTTAGLQKLKQAQPRLDTAMEKQHISLLIKQLDDAADAMDSWMQKFNPDAQGKSNGQAVSYFQAEKLKVMQLDSLYQKALEASGSELKKLQISTTVKGSNAHMKMKM